MKKLVVFDVDGTILDSLSVFRRVLMEYSAEQGLPEPCFHSIMTGYGEPHAHDFKWGVSREKQVEHLYAAYRISDALGKSGKPEYMPQLYAGVREGLEHLQDLGYTLALVTSKPEDPLLHTLEHCRVTHMFAGIRHGNDEQRRGEKEKPHPDQLVSLIKELSFHPEESVMIGDTTMDMLMGRGAKTQTMGVTWGAHRRDLLADAGAHHIVERHFDDVPLTVKKIFS